MTEQEAKYILARIDGFNMLFLNQCLRAEIVEDLIPKRNTTTYGVDIERVAADLGGIMPKIALFFSFLSAEDFIDSLMCSMIEFSTCEVHTEESGHSSMVRVYDEEKAFRHWKRFSAQVTEDEEPKAFESPSVVGDALNAKLNEQGLGIDEHGNIYQLYREIR